MDDLISREEILKLPQRKGYAVNGWEAYVRVSDIKELPSAQPDTDEWCTDCAEYDNERNCCPRFYRVIKTALEDAQPERKRGKWINNSPVTLKCNCCGYVISDWEWSDMNFCPNCGLYMRGGDEG